MNSYCWRASLLTAAVLLGLAVTIITEFLSAFRAITFAWILAAWVLMLLSVVCFSAVNTRKRIKPVRETAKPDSFSIVYLSVLLVYIAIIGGIAVLSPPNNFESMKYHMPRVMHWIQNQSVANYPTNYLPQICLPPWHEYAIMHFQILSGSDRFANMISWFGFSGCLIAVSLIAKILGAQKRGQFFAAVFCVTIPMAILQGSNPQNDITLAFWMSCFMYFALRLIKGDNRRLTILCTGISLGLMLFTKSTAYYFLVPLIAWFVFLIVKRTGNRWFRITGVVFIAAFFINLPFYWRNVELFHLPLGSPQNLIRQHNNEAMNLRLFISTIIKNIALHSDVINIKNLETINPQTMGPFAQGLVRVHKVLNVNIHDSRITYEAFRVPGSGAAFDENTAGNPVHLWLIGMGLIFYLLSRKSREVLVTWYLIAVIGAFLQFCLIHKWDFFSSRYHLPLFVLFAPVMGIVLQNIRFKIIASSAVFILIVYSLPFLFYHKMHHLIGRRNVFNTPRIEQYFINCPWPMRHYVEAADFVKKSRCRHIGFDLNRNNWEYPLWMLLKNQKVLIEHVNVQNESAVLAEREPFKNFKPGAIIVFSAQPPEKIKRLQSDAINIPGKGKYERRFNSGPISVYLPG